MVKMAKKSRTGKIKTGVFEYSWTKEINKVETNKKFIQSQIDSFILLIENKESITKLIILGIIVLNTERLSPA